jgi:hypothetical protein
VGNRPEVASLPVYNPIQHPTSAASLILWHVEPLLGSTVTQAIIQQPLIGKDSATDMNATVPQQQEDTTIMGSGVFCAVRAEML